MTVPDVLDAIGWPTGRYRRTSCPLHRGSNRSAFSYTDWGWHCFSGCGSGSAQELAHRLGVTQKPLLGMAFPAFMIDREIAKAQYNKLSARMARIADRKFRELEEDAAKLHYDALRALGDVEQGVRLGLPSDLLAEVYTGALRDLERAHRVFQQPCPPDCGRALPRLGYVPTWMLDYDRPRFGWNKTRGMGQLMLLWIAYLLAPETETPPQDHSHDGVSVSAHEAEPLDTGREGPRERIQQ